MTWINTDWFRTETYYASGGWRATWKGEGGGVLLNQCLHNLDVLSWLFGRPSKIRGFCQFGQWHQIEVEDQVTAWFEYPDGATGTFLSSTGEAPGTNRLEIAGSRGRLVLENNRLTFTRNASDALEWSRTATVGFSKPEVSTVEIPFTDAPHPHATLLENFVGAILDASLRVGLKPRPGVLPYLNLRYIGGGAEGLSDESTPPGDGYNRNWLNTLAVSAGTQFK